MEYVYCMSLRVQEHFRPTDSNATWLYDISKQRIQNSVFGMLNLIVYLFSISNFFGLCPLIVVNKSVSCIAHDAEFLFYAIWTSRVSERYQQCGVDVCSLSQHRSSCDKHLVLKFLSCDKWRPVWPLLIDYTTIALLEEHSNNTYSAAMEAKHSDFGYGFQM